MYLSTVRAGASVKGAPVRRLLTGNVLALGLVSLVTDVSAEMVTSVLPAFLVLGLHLSVAQYGALDGLYTGATALTRLAGGYVADRYRHRKLVAGLGAFAGPLVALGVLALAGSSRAYDAVFLASLCVAVFGVLLLALFVRDRRGELPAVRVSPQAAFGLLRGRRFRALCVAAVLLGLSTVGDGFVYLILQRRDDLPVLAFPLLAVGTSLAYLLLAIPAGWLADRAGRWPVVLAGYAALLAVYLLLASGHGSLPLILLLYGAFYAGTDGVLMALAGPLLPEGLRTSGRALVQSGQALAYLGSSVLFGLAWQFWGVPAACLAAAGGVAVVLPVSAILLKGRDS